MDLNTVNLAPKSSLIGLGIQQILDFNLDAIRIVSVVLNIHKMPSYRLPPDAVLAS